MAVDYKVLSRQEVSKLGELIGKKRDEIPLTASEQWDYYVLNEKMEIKSSFNEIKRDYITSTDRSEKLAEAEAKVSADKAAYEKAQKTYVKTGLLSVPRLEATQEDHNLVAADEARWKETLDIAEAMTVEQNKRKQVTHFEESSITATINSEVRSIDAAREEQRKKDSTSTEYLSDKAWEERQASYMFPRPKFLTKDTALFVKVQSDPTQPKYNQLVSEKNPKEYTLSTSAVEPKDKLDEKDQIVSGGFGDTIGGDMYSKLMDGVFKKSGYSGTNNQIVSCLRDIDRFQTNILAPNYETSDITLMTRPILPLGSLSIRHDSFLSALDTKITNSTDFYIRCLLDGNWASDNAGLTSKCPMYNPFSPWIPIVTNRITSISGFPDPILETKTTEGGYHQEDQTYVKGGTGLHRSVTLNLNFNDIQGGILIKLFQVWIEVMAQLRDGRMMSYLKYIDENKIPYSVSIYQFNLDPTKTYLTNWVKATTCFPVSVPLGAIMNKAENQRHVTSAGQFTIPFMCNYVAYNRLEHIAAFNKLTERYYLMGSKERMEKIKNLEPTLGNNYNGIPYIESDNYGLKLVYKANPGTQ